MLHLRQKGAQDMVKADLNVGPVTPELLARGVRVVTMREASASGTRHLSGHQGRDTAIVADVFDRMEVEARQAHDRRGVGLEFAPPFTPGQIYIARHYRALTEAHSAQGMRGCLSSMLPRGGGGGRDAVDMGLAMRETLVRMRRNALCGNPVVLSPRRDMGRGNTRRTILLSDVLDGVCLNDLRPAQVLVSFGWGVDTASGAKSKTVHRRELRDALRAALDRMQGYAGYDLQNVGGAPKIGG
jgi:hypothetical protein